MYTTMKQSAVLKQNIYVPPGNSEAWMKKGLNGKESEIVRELKQSKLEVLALTETKKKGQGIHIYI